MAARGDLLALAAAQDVGHVRGAETLPDPRDARQDLARDDDRLGHRFQLAEAVVAGAAVVASDRPRRNSRRGAVPAADAGGVALHVAQQLAALGAQLAVPLEHHAPLQEVGGRVDEHALGLEAVAAGAAGLLLVVLERLRRAGVHDEAHVGAVDAHAEGDRGDDDVDVFVEERVLVPCRSSSSSPAWYGDARGRPSSRSHAASASTSRRDVQ